MFNQIPSINACYRPPKNKGAQNNETETSSKGFHLDLDEWGGGRQCLQEPGQLGGHFLYFNTTTVIIFYFYFDSKHKLSLF